MRYSFRYSLGVTKRFLVASGFNAGLIRDAGVLLSDSDIELDDVNIRRIYHINGVYNRWKERSLNTQFGDGAEESASAKLKAMIVTGVGTRR